MNHSIIRYPPSARASPSVQAHAVRLAKNIQVVSLARRQHASGNLSKFLCVLTAARPHALRAARTIFLHLPAATSYPPFPLPPHAAPAQALPSDGLPGWPLAGVTFHPDMTSFLLAPGLAPALAAYFHEAASRGFGDAAADGADADAGADGGGGAEGGGGGTLGCYAVASSALHIVTQAVVVAVGPARMGGGDRGRGAAVAAVGGEEAAAALAASITRCVLLPCCRPAHLRCSLLEAACAC